MNYQNITVDVKNAKKTDKFMWLIVISVISFLFLLIYFLNERYIRNWGYSFAFIGILMLYSVINICIGYLLTRTIRNSNRNKVNFGMIIVVLIIVLQITEYKEIAQFFLPFLHNEVINEVAFSFWFLPFIQLIGTLQKKDEMCQPLEKS